MEEKKAENELNMKREIRALLEAYLQIKNQDPTAAVGDGGDQEHEDDYCDNVQNNNTVMTTANKR